ncbi:uncharacterized protein [Misgurnus anguillicaudatus]|uniref:uncharacterized protein n=1 Tax=Misgurnus anguillicaudatus TaxID=75329 RepID=UPI003CCFB2F3
MKKKEISVIFPGFIMILTLTGSVVGGGNVGSRKPSCNRANFDADIYEKCVLPFNRSMAAVDYQLKCPWPTTRQYYVKLYLCMENLANITSCSFVHSTHEVLLKIHQVYYLLCTHMMDPDWHLLVLYILPCIILTFIIPVFFHKFKLYENTLPKYD